MKIERGGIYTIAAKGAYTGKPRPAIVVQSDALPLGSVVIIPLTSEYVEASSIRVPLQASLVSGLKNNSWAMCDKISTIPSANLKDRIGTADTSELRQIGAALVRLLDLLE